MSNRQPSRGAIQALMVAPAFLLLGCATAPNQHGMNVARGALAADTSSIAGHHARTIETLFLGRFPGVDVHRMMDGGVQILVRGGSNSFYAGNAPLYVVDETPIPTDPRGIVFLNPYDIQRIEILKNPADIAIYGMRGSNGVIKITTKGRGARQ